LGEIDTTMAGGVAFFDRTYDEALALTREARDYIGGQGASERRAMTPDAMLVASCEEMRLTARMTQVMAWLLVQRAVHAGEMTRSQAAAKQHRLSGQDACLSGPVAPEVELPARLNDLLSRSRNLYERVQRLDATLDG
jgi:regulator of CtrA degradation